MSDEPSPLKDAIMDAVYTPLERDDMQTPCTLPFMTSSEHGVCDGDGFPVSDETIASALDAVAKIQTEYYKVKKETQKETQKEMTDEPSPRPWHAVDYAKCPGLADVFDASGSPSGLVAGELKPADAALIVDAVNERDRLRDIVRRLSRHLANYITSESENDLLREARAAIGEDKE